jgi:acyl phosphate:glycerol-3-phosphate acyltransferase
VDASAASRIAGVVAFAFLIGSIPWALVIGKVFYHVDVRAVGSGNLGATNVFRVLGRVAGTATFLLDAAKGICAVLVAVYAVPASVYGESAHQWAMIGATLAAMAGHSFSPFVGFKGGKGVATAAGALLVLTPKAWPFLLGIWLVTVAIWRMVSLGSVAIAFAYPFLCAWLYPGEWPILGFSVVAAALVIWRHSSNIKRILAGTESKISLGRGTAARDRNGE